MCPIIPTAISTSPVSALSLTRPAVARDFSSLTVGIEQTSSLAQELRLFLELVFIWFTLRLLSPVFISLVLPTSHLFDHHRP
jgi:hypothetical protein